MFPATLKNRRYKHFHIFCIKMQVFFFCRRYFYNYNIFLPIFKINYGKAHNLLITPPKIGECFCLDVSSTALAIKILLYRIARTPTALRAFAMIGAAIARAFSTPFSSILSNSSVLFIRSLYRSRFVANVDSSNSNSSCFIAP